MYNFYLAIKDTTVKRSIPVLWTSSKTYYEENGTKSHAWSWADPWLTFDFTIPEILRLCEKTPPHVFGFSIYVWNESYMDDLARLVKNQHPECIIIYGGPQVNVRYDENFFVHHHWVDAVCPSDGYGEIIIKEVLDNYPIKDWEIIPYVWYADQNRHTKFSSKPIEKKTFSWPKNIYKAQEKYFANHLNDIESVILETTRGCPYKCIYCDWGGGTYTKLNSKPFDTVLDEIEWVAKNKIAYLGFPSANFGILPIDTAIAQHCVDMKQQYGFPKYVHHEPAKNNVDRVGRIQAIFVGGDMMNHVKISIQAINEEIKNNIERIDPPLDRQVANVQRLHALNPDLPVKIETIIGLPGDNYQTTLDQFDVLYSFDLPMPRNHVWMLLPEAPAYSPEMRKKFCIGTTNSVFATFPFQIKYNTTELQLEDVKAYTIEYAKNLEIVVETYSYSRTEFIDMWCISNLALALEYLGLRYTLIPYLNTHYNMKFSDVMDFVYTEFMKNPQSFDDDFLSNQFQKIYQAQKNCAQGVSKDNLVDFDPSFPFLLSTPNYIGFIILMQIEKFMGALCLKLSAMLKDDRIIDLGHYIRHSIIDVTYDPDLGRSFYSRYNWLEYFNKHEPLVEHTVRYCITDKELYVNTRMQQIDWHKAIGNMQRMIQYTFKQITEISNKTSKTIYRSGPQLVDN